MLTFFPKLFLSKNKYKLLLLVSVITIILLENLFPALLFSFEFLLNNGLLLNAVFMCFCFSFLPFTIAVFIYLAVKRQKVTNFFWWLVFTIIPPAILSMFFKNVIPYQAWVFMFVVVTLILIVLAECIVLDIRKGFAKVYFNYLLLSIILCFPTFISRTSGFIYNPPVLTNKDIAIYKTVIDFLEEHDGIKYLYLNPYNGIRFMPLTDEADFWPRHSDAKKKAGFGEKEFTFLIRLRDQLLNINCIQFERVDDTVLFYKNIYRIFPTGPGLAYSLNSSNPNESKNEILEKAKPFKKLTGNWYISRKLIIAGPRMDIKVEIPEPLIDLSDNWIGSTAYSGMYD